MTIYNKENSGFLTDAQWLTLLRLVDEPTVELDSMLLTMPAGENCPADLTWKGEHYVIHPDGRAEVLA